MKFTTINQHVHNQCITSRFLRCCVSLTSSTLTAEEPMYLAGQAQAFGHTRHRQQTLRPVSRSHLTYRILSVRSLSQGWMVTDLHRSGLRFEDPASSGAVLANVVLFAYLWIPLRWLFLLFPTRLGLEIVNSYNLLVWFPAICEVGRYCGRASFATLMVQCWRGRQFWNTRT